jgi:hypothetical protein
MKALFTLFSLAFMTIGHAQRNDLPAPGSRLPNGSIPARRIPSVFAPASKPESAPNYEQLIITGDRYFNEKNYALAIEKYNKALYLRQEEYPKDQIQRAKALQDRARKDQALQAEDAREAKITAEYERSIAEADQHFKAHAYQEAIYDYEQALTLRQEKYPETQIHRAKAELVSVEQARVEKDKASKAEQKAEKPSGYHEFVVRTLETNRWTEAALVCDISPSLENYNAAVLAWVKTLLEAKDTSIRQVVYFGDSEKIEQSSKGLFSFKPSTYEDAVQRMQTAKEQSSGGDYNENNIHALLKAQSDTPSGECLIMICDNYTPWDYYLAYQVTKPVHIILCGYVAYVDPTYLNLARTTKGSIHLNGDSYTGLDTYTEGMILKVGLYKFMIRDNQFVFYQSPEEKEQALQDQKAWEAYWAKWEEGKHVLKVLSANNWTHAALVCDIGFNPEYYTDELMVWLRNQLGANDQSIRRVVYFADGSNYQRSFIELTSFEPKSYEDAEQRMRKPKQRDPGQKREDNLHALLKAQEDAPSAENLVLVSYNKMPEDPEIASQIKKPVHIILYGQTDRLETFYLNLARNTKGSLHLNGQSYTQLDVYTDGSTLELGTETFLVRNNQFVKFSSK